MGLHGGRAYKGLQNKSRAINSSLELQHGNGSTSRVGSTSNAEMGVSQNWGYLLGGRMTTYWGLYWGPCFGKLPNLLGVPGF